METSFKETKNPKILKTISYLLLLLSFTATGYYFGRRGFLLEFKDRRPEVVVQNQKQEHDNVDFATFWRVWDLIYDRALYYHDPQDLLYGAITGLTEATDDPYTSFLTPKQNDVFADGLAGKYEGIGVELANRDDRLLIISPLEGSPAEKAGIKAGDVIVEVDGEATRDMSMSEAVSKIRGEAGTGLVLGISRSADSQEEILDIDIQRDTITVPSVRWEDLGDNVVRLRLSRFGDGTQKQWEEAVTEIKQEHPVLNGLVLDLRGNPGGYLTGSVFVVSEFVPKNKVVLIEEFNDGTRQTVETKPGGRLYDVPVAVLVDNGSASSSEIVAAALRHHINATIVGKTSFGKGTIQDARDFQDGSGIHLTVAKWLDPADNWYHDKGVEPDVEVEYDAEAEEDPQIEAAKEALLK